MGSESTPAKDEESSINVTGAHVHALVHPQEATPDQIAKMNKADGGHGDDVVDPNNV